MEMNLTDKLYVPTYLLSKKDLKREVINWFNNAVKYNTFMYISTEDNKVIGYGSTIPFDLLKEVAPMLSKKYSLKVSASACYCGHGPFIGLVINK